MNKLFFALIALLFSTSIFTQSIERQVIGSAGFESKIPTLSMTATVGETATAMFSVGNFQLTQGFEQPDDGTTEAKEPVTIAVQYAAFPNPTEGILNVNIWLDQPAELGISLCAADGKVLRELLKIAPLPVGQTTNAFKINDLAAGNYWLEIMEKPGRSVRTMAIVKI